jgi:hypothetical protein
LFGLTVFRPWEPKALNVHSYFAGWSLRRRVIALAAAYALALGGLFASWAAGSAAALATAGPGTVTCHSDAGEPAPAQNDGSGHVCLDSCCVGCVLLTAALPPPPLKAIGAPQSAAPPLAATPAPAAPAGHSARSHQSRAPPLRV